MTENKWNWKRDKLARSAVYSAFDALLPEDDGEELDLLGTGTSTIGTDEIAEAFSRALGGRLPPGTTPRVLSHRRRFKALLPYRRFDHSFDGSRVKGRLPYLRFDHWFNNLEYDDAMWAAYCAAKKLVEEDQELQIPLELIDASVAQKRQEALDRMVDAAMEAALDRVKLPTYKRLKMWPPLPDMPQVPATTMVNSVISDVYLAGFISGMNQRLYPWTDPDWEGFSQHLINDFPKVFGYDWPVDVEYADDSDSDDPTYKAGCLQGEDVGESLYIGGFGLYFEAGCDFDLVDGSTPKIPGDQMARAVLIRLARVVAENNQ